MSLYHQRQYAGNDIYWFAQHEIKRRGGQKGEEGGARHILNIGGIRCADFIALFIVYCHIAIIGIFYYIIEFIIPFFIHFS
jgi:hypothetical protein